MITLGVPTFPKITLNCEIEDLVGEESWFLIEKLGKHNILDQHPLSWNHLDCFNKAKKHIDILKIVNDPAERAEKLMTDFLGKITRDDHQALLMQVDENR